MGSSGEANNGIDPSVGGLVWVRRRNGSWWPGRILGQDELPESYLASPRMGTPVKLLGREDASVDWYNLEKSKRVKAFRCGEYDDCIEKAKATAANSTKKAVKYARREDAIIHALEIESARQCKSHLDFCSSVDEQAVEEEHGLKESPTKVHSDEETVDTIEKLSNSADNSNSMQELSQSGVSFEESNHISVSKEQSLHCRQRRTPNDSEDDGNEGIKRMRGLEDLGMGVVSSLKRKRSQVAHVHEFLKRKHRRRTLTKVLESTAMVSVPIMCEQLGSPTGSSLLVASDSKVFGLDSTESKKSFSMVINNNSDSTGVSCENGNALNVFERSCDASLVNCKQKEREISSMSGLFENDSSDKLFDVPLVGEEKNFAGFSPLFASSAPQKPQVGTGAQSSQSSQIETVSLGNEIFNESGSTSSGTAGIDQISDRIGKGTSKWQLKGKRNSRHTGKNKRQGLRITMDVDDESDAYSLGSGWKLDCNPMDGSVTSDVCCTYQAKHRPTTETQIDEFRGWSRHVSHKESLLSGAMAEVATPQRSLPYRQSRFTINPKYNSSDFTIRNYGAEPLYDVNVKVKSSYRPQHVPYISLMSKLSGQSIIGHPLTVEILDYGLCDLLLSGSEYYSSSCELDYDLGENTSALKGVDMSYEIRPNSHGKIPTKHLALQSRVPQRKSLKLRKNGLLSKKIRKLSSLTGSHGQSGGKKKAVVEKLKGPAVAYVPVKVIFSRINAALNSSMRPAHRVTKPS